MEFLQPETWPEALQMKAAHPQAVPIQGGTDVMVELNFDRYRPEYLLDLTRVSELAQWAPDNGHIRLGAGVSYTRVITELGDRLPGLAMASRTVGSSSLIRKRTRARGVRRSCDTAAIIMVRSDTSRWMRACMRLKAPAAWRSS